MHIQKIPPLNRFTRKSCSYYVFMTQKYMLNLVCDLIPCTASNRQC